MLVPHYFLEEPETIFSTETANFPFFLSFYDLRNCVRVTRANTFLCFVANFVTFKMTILKFFVRQIKIVFIFPKRKRI